MKSCTAKIKFFIAMIVVVINAACATYEYHETRSNQLDRVTQNASFYQDQMLLDVGIVLFDAGVDELDEESVAYANVRRSEAVWYSQQLKSSLEKSNAWGIVRNLPNVNTVFDLTVEGEILESNGEDLLLNIEVYDATGKQWLSKEYFERVSKYAYDPEIELNRDPFQNLFNDIANDLFTLRAELAEDDIRAVRDIAKIRFAQQFSPEIFSDYLAHDNQLGYQLVRLPAETDPALQRIERIRARNDLFLDVIQDYYRIFNHNMTAPYDEWRKLSYKEVLYQRQLAKQAKQEKIAGVAIILSGVLAATGDDGSETRAAGHVGISSGADIFLKSYRTQQEASFHAEALREFGESLEVELEPSVIDLQDRTITLSGTVEDQFKEWRRILQEMHETEQSILGSDQVGSKDYSNIGINNADTIGSNIVKSARKQQEVNSDL